MANSFEGWVKSSIRNRKRKTRSSAAAAVAVAVTATAAPTPTPSPSNSNDEATPKQEQYHETDTTTVKNHTSISRDSSSSSRPAEKSTFSSEIATKATEKLNRRAASSSAATSTAAAASTNEENSSSSSSSPAGATTTTKQRNNSTAATDASSYQHLDDMEDASSSLSPVLGDDKRKKARLMSTTTAAAAAPNIAKPPTMTKQQKTKRRVDTNVSEQQQQQQQQQQRQEGQCNNSEDICSRSPHGDSSDTSKTLPTKKSAPSTTLTDTNHHHHHQHDDSTIRPNPKPKKRIMRQLLPESPPTTTTTTAMENNVQKSTRKEENKEAQAQTRLIQRLHQTNAQLQKKRQEENQSQTLLIQRLQTTNAQLQKDQQQLKTRIKHLQLEANQLRQAAADTQQRQAELQRLQAENQALLRQAAKLEQQRNHDNTVSLQHVLSIVVRQRLEMETVLQNALCPESTSTSNSTSSNNNNNSGSRSDSENSLSAAAAAAAAMPLDTSTLLPAQGHDGFDAFSTIEATASHPVDTSRILDVAMAAPEQSNNHSSGPDSPATDSEPKIPPPKVSLTSSRNANDSLNRSNMSPPPRVTDVAMHSFHHPPLLEEEEEEDEDGDSFPDDLGETQAISGPFKLSTPDAASPKGQLPSSAPNNTTTKQSAEHEKWIKTAVTSKGTASSSWRRHHFVLQPATNSVVNVAELYCMPISTGTTTLTRQGSTNETRTGRKLVFEESSESSSQEEDSQATRESIRATKSSKRNVSESLNAATASMQPPTVDSSVTLPSKKATAAVRQSTITLDPVIQQKASLLVKIVVPADKTPNVLPPPAEDTRRRVTMENPYTKPLDPRSIGRPPIWNQRPLGNSTNAAAHLPGSGWVSNQPARAFMKEMDDGIANSSLSTTANASTWVSAKRHTNRKPQGKKPVDIWDDESQQPEYKYHEVVRCKEKRNALPCYDCPDCREFYEYLRKTGHEFEKFNAPIDYSRHRSRFTPPETPDDFWEIDFIDEKRAADQAAAEARKQQQLNKRL